MLCNTIPISQTTVSVNLYKIASFTKAIDESPWNKIVSKYNGTLLKDSAQKILLIANTVDRKYFSDILASRKVSTLLKCDIDGVDCSDDSAFEDVYHEKYMKCMRFIPRNSTFRRLEMVLFADSLIANDPLNNKFEDIQLRSIRFDSRLEHDSTSGLLAFIYSNNTFPRSPLRIGTGANTLIQVFQTDKKLYERRKKSCAPNYTVIYKSFIGRCR